MKECDEQWGYCRAHDNDGYLVDKYCKTYVKAMHEEIHQMLDELHFWKCGCNGILHKDIEIDWILNKCPFCKEEET